MTVMSRAFWLPFIYVFLSSVPGNPRNALSGVYEIDLNHGFYCQSEDLPQSPQVTFGEVRLTEQGESARSVKLISGPATLSSPINLNTNMSKQSSLCLSQGGQYSCQWGESYTLRFSLLSEVEPLFIDKHSFFKLNAKLMGPSSSSPQDVSCWLAGREISSTQDSLD